MALNDAMLQADEVAGGLEEAELEDYEPIEKLQTLGIAVGDIKKAREAGYHTVQSFCMYPKKVLVNIKGLSEAKVDKMVEAAKKLYTGCSWRTGTVVAAERERGVVKITTGCKAFDDVLGGGMETRSLVEMYGEYRCGKTQVCMTMCVTCQLDQESGGGAGKVAYVDTEGTFRPERIKAIAERFNLDPESVLDNIVVARAFNHEHQMDLLLSIAALMVQDPFKLLIVDSLTAHFRTDFTGRGELADRQQKLGQLLARLKKIADEFNVVVLLTNQVVSDPGGGATFVSDPKKAVGGHVVAHAMTTRLSLRKGKAEQRLVKVVESPCLAEAEASFQVGNGGVEDYKD